MKTLKQSIMVSIVFLILCGFIYPLLITGISQVIFNNKANGSIINFNGNKTGSALIGQNFTDPRFFKGRVSSISYNTYNKSSENINKVNSGSSNLAPSNKELADRVKKDIDAFMSTHPEIKKEDIPADLLTNSGSGLDPDISPKAAEIQVPAVSKASGISEADLRGIVGKYTEGRSLGVFGEPRVNVLKVNLEIANILKKNGKL
jgi:K+-transporting ATPase ATPase C chain